MNIPIALRVLAAGVMGISLVFASPLTVNIEQAHSLTPAEIQAACKIDPELSICPGQALGGSGGGSGGGGGGGAGGGSNPGVAGSTGGGGSSSKPKCPPPGSAEPVPLTGCGYTCAPGREAQCEEIDKVFTDPYKPKKGKDKVKQSQEEGGQEEQSPATPSEGQEEQSPATPSEGQEEAEEIERPQGKLPRE